MGNGKSEKSQSAESLTYDKDKEEKPEKNVQVAPPVMTMGISLPEPTRHEMETKYCTDFSDVRVHQGPQATMVGAQAYTTGNNIHFAPGQYNPHSPAGQELLGHELAHVVQQRSGRVNLAKGLVQT